MVTMNIFQQDAFSTIQLTTAVERNPFNPTGLGDLGIFEDAPVRTEAMMVEERDGQLVIIPFSERGQEGTQRTTEKRKARFFDIPRIMHADTITARELQGIRAFGTESELMQLEAEVARRLSGPTGLQSNVEYTWEYHRLAAVQGLLLDADGSVKYDFAAEFGRSLPAEINFNLAANVAGSLRPIINTMARSMARASKGAMIPSSRIVGLCGDDFYDKLTTHTDVEKTYLNWAAAADLREGGAFQMLPFAGVDWVNYRGSDDASTIAVPHDKVKFFPRGAPGVFQRGLAPGESFEWVNTPGKPMYVIPIMDKDRNSWWKMEVYSYPLHICTRPELLYSGRQ